MMNKTMKFATKMATALAVAGTVMGTMGITAMAAEFDGTQEAVYEEYEKYMSENHENDDFDLKDYYQEYADYYVDEYDAYCYVNGYDNPYKEKENKPFRLSFKDAMDLTEGIFDLWDEIQELKRIYWG